VPVASRSTITLSSVHWLQLLPPFDCFGRYVCDIPLSTPTRGGFYTSRLSLGCSHTPGDTDITLGSDWIAACSAAFCDDTAELTIEDPGASVVASLPVGHYWTPNDGTNVCLSATLLTNMHSLADAHTLCNDSIDIDVVLSELNRSSNHPNFDLPAFFDVLLTLEDFISHFLNGKCAGCKAPGCREVARGVWSRYWTAMNLT
jgi:hypothetical protein